MANELFLTLNEHKQHHILAYGGEESYLASLKLSAFEIQDEVITDLLKPESRGLGIAMTTDSGVAVRGLHQEVKTSSLKFIYPSIYLFIYQSINLFIYIWLKFTQMVCNE